MRLILALTLMTTPALAQDTALLDPALRAAPGAVARYLQAVDLYALGQQARDPLLVVAAARLIRGLTLTDVARLPDPPPPAQAPVAPLDAAEMIATARSLDAGATYIDLIEQVAAESVPKSLALSATGSTLPPGKAETWTLTFYGGTYAELAILGDGRSNLDMTVTGAADEVICADRGSADRAICGFALADNGAVKVLVTNTGPNPATYMLLTE